VALTEGSEEQLGFDKLRKVEESALLAEGFDPAGGELWRRDGIYFGREAALQNTHRSLLQRGVYAAYDKSSQDQGTIKRPATLRLFVYAPIPGNDELKQSRPLARLQSLNRYRGEGYPSLP
jgi:hypothetical protein